ncbi:Alpha/Beta hydrolase protein [Xylaria cf. heliscus]|nr:Alpha/Beta hydrolase protein [Xylaria cf. heliscus]
MELKTGKGSGESPPQTERTKMYRFYKGEFFNFETIRILGTARYGGAEVGEVLEAVGQIKENDPEGWYRAWSKQSTMVEAIAEEAQRHGHHDAARMAFLRASNYTRASAYMMIGDKPLSSDPRIVPILKNAIRLFQKALRLMDSTVHILQIPYEDSLKLPAYLYLPPPSRRLSGKVPLVINFIGADSIQEEIFYMFPAAGPDLGYAVLTVEGPGQGLTLHEHNVPFRADWEVIMQRTLKYLSQYVDENPALELDFDRIAVAGASLGGLFALRAAAEPQVRACVAIDPLYDLWDFATMHVSPTFLGLWERGWISDRVVDRAISLATWFSFQMKWEIATSSRFLGTSSPSETLRAMKRFTLRENDGSSYLGGVKCPVYVTGAANSLYLDLSHHTGMVAQNLLDSQKTIWVSTTPGEGSLQAKMGALGLCNQRTFQFLDRELGIVRND